jgi:hypothetical protein
VGHFFPLVTVRRVHYSFQGARAMRRVLLGLSLTCAIVSFSVTQSPACGDKVLALGRAVKLRYLSAHSTSILVYARAGTPAAGALSDPKLQHSLMHSSQTLKYVTSPAELDEALDHAKYDLVLTDAGDAGVTEQKLQAIYSHTVVVPVLNAGTKAEASALMKQYHVILKTPGKPDSFLFVLDEAVEMKTKRDQSKELAKK